MALRSIFYFLVKNPDKYRKLVAEIDSAEEVGKLSPFISYKEGNELEYLYEKAGIPNRLLRVNN